MEQTDIQIQTCNEMAVHISLGQTISPHIQRQVRAVGAYIESHPFAGYKECVVSYTAVTIVYDPFIVRTQEKTDNAQQFVKSYAQQAVQHADMDSLPQARDIVIPVCYGRI